MKMLLGLSLIATLSGCGYIDRGLATVTGSLSEVCHDEVVYLQGTSGLSVAYKKNGSIKTCED